MLGLILAFISIDFLLNYKLFDLTDGLFNLHEYETYPSFLKGSLRGPLFLIGLFCLDFVLIYKFICNRISLIEKIFLFFITTSFINFYLNYNLVNGAYPYIIAILFWIMLLTELTQDPPPKIFHFLIRLQIVVVYFFSVILKRGDDWLVNLNAVEYTMRSSYAVPFIKQYVDIWAPLGVFKYLTILTLLIEIIIPVLILIPSKNKIYDKLAAYLVLFFHLSIYFFTEPLIFFVCAFGLNSLILFPENKILESLSLKSSFWLDKSYLFFSKLKKELAIGTIAIFSMFSIVMTNIIEVKRYSIGPSLNYFMNGTNFYQSWSMFAPSGPLSRSWVEIIGKGKNGNIINIFEPTKKIGIEPKSYKNYYPQNHFIYSHFTRAFQPTSNEELNKIRFYNAGKALVYFCQEYPQYIELELIFYRTQTKTYIDNAPENTEQESIVHITCKDLKSISTSILN